jgi:hypothetical protein
VWPLSCGCENISANNRGASMTRTEKERKRRERWEKMKKRGHLMELALNGFIWAGSCVLVSVTHILCHITTSVGSTPRARSPGKIF